MRFALLTAAALTLSANVALAQNIEGAYSLAGVNQDKTTYSGTVEVKKLGSGYQIQWDMDGEKTFGAGLLEGTTLYVGTVYDSKSVVSVMKADGANLKGTWYRRTEPGLGEEVWLKR